MNVSFPQAAVISSMGLGLFAAGFLLRPYIENQSSIYKGKESSSETSSQVIAHPNLPAPPTSDRAVETSLVLQTPLEEKPNLSDAKTFRELEEESSRLLRLAESDPKLAIDLATRNGSKVTEETRLELLAIWAVQSPQEAWQWTLDNGIDRPSEILTAIAKDDPRLAYELLNGQDLALDDSRRLAFGQAIVAGYAHSGDYQGALQFVSGLESGKTPLSFDDRHVFYTQLSEAWLHFGSEDALAFLDSASDNDGQVSSELRTDFFQTWTLKDPSAALAYALEMPESQDREAIFQEGLSHWAAKDLKAASDWMNEHGQGAEFDEIVYQFSGSLPVNSDTIAESLDWAQSIHDPALRQKGMAELLDAWLREEPDQALSFLKEDSTLPVEVFRLALEMQQSDLDGSTESVSPIPD